MPKGFFPVQDTGLIQGLSQAAAATSYEAMARYQQDLAAVILKDPDVVSLSSFIGVDGSNLTLNTGRFLVNLRPREDRTADASQIIRRLHARGGRRAGRGALPPAGAGPDDRDRDRGDAVPVRARDPRTRTISALGRRASSTRLRQLPQLADVASDPQPGGLSAYVTIDRATAARFGITAATIDNALYDAFGQRIVSTIFSQSNQYRVILEADPSLQTSLDALGSIYLPSATATGGQVPLSAIATVEERQAPLQINHLGQFPAITVSFNVAQGASLGEAVAAIRAAERDIGLPAGCSRASRGRRSPSRRRSPTSCCSSWRRSSRCISSWACSTRATSTRSRSSRPCPRPASGRCSP